jgi:GDP-mannose 6-dehydrogenase
VREMNVSIFGLGYVGTVCAACLANEGHEVIGVDVNAAKVESINSGVAPIVEPDIGALIADGRRSGKLRATISALDAIRDSELSLVCVGTPSLPNGRLNLSYLTRVCEEIGAALRAKESPHAIALRSTMLPGTTEGDLLPILEKHSGKQAGRAMTVCYNPEFLREGSSVHDFYHPPKIVVGERDEFGGERLLQLFSGIRAPLIRTSIRVAEMVKYTDNAFHALKISFANEIGNLCKKMGVDSHEVMEIFCQDTKLNLAPAYLKPGFAFGGSCLPKDLRALAYQSKRFDLESPVLEAILRSNAYQIRVALQRILDQGKKSVGFLGMAFKANTDDLRESPLVDVIETLLGKGYRIRIYDRHVSLSRLVGANKQFVDEHIPHLSTLLVHSVDELVSDSDVIVVGHQSPEFASALKHLRSSQTVIDLARAAKVVETPARYDGICW